MSILHVTVFQKELGKSLDLTTMRGLSRLKSDFLLFPEYFYADKRVNNYEELAKASPAAEGWLTRVSELYKGSVIGGGSFHAIGRETHVGIPVLRKGAIIDWHDKCELNKEEKKIAVPGKGEGIFILEGVCFAVVAYADLKQKSYLEFLERQKIQLVFAQANFSSSFDRNKMQKPLVDCARKYKLTIVICCGVGKLFPNQIGFGGLSSVITPYGISWQVHPNETSKELLKTIMLSYSPTREGASFA